MKFKDAAYSVLINVSLIQWLALFNKSLTERTELDLKLKGKKGIFLTVLSVS